MILQKIKNNKGFVLLFAVTLTGIIVSIALGIASISFKELSFNTSDKNANEAFSAADTGIECALFNDKSESPFVEGGGNTIQCLGSDITLSGSFPSWNFVVPGLGS